MSIPVGIAPTAMQKMAHPEGECANVRGNKIDNMCLCKRKFIRQLIPAAQALGTIFTLSTISTSSIEEVAEAAPSCVKWFQLYIYKDR